MANIWSMSEVTIPLWKEESRACKNLHHGNQRSTQVSLLAKKHVRSSIKYVLKRCVKRVHVLSIRMVQKVGTRKGTSKGIKRTRAGRFELEYCCVNSLRLAWLLELKQALCIPYDKCYASRDLGWLRPACVLWCVEEADSPRHRFASRNVAIHFGGVISSARHTISPTTNC